MPFMMSDYYDAQKAALAAQIQRQVLEENDIKLQRQREEAANDAKAKAILTENANRPVPTETFDLGQGILPGESAGIPKETLAKLIAPTVMAPAEGLKGLGGMSTPTTAPAGLQPEADLTGLGGMQQADNPIPPVATEEEPVKAETPLAKAEETAKTYTRVASELDQVKQNADQLRKAGLHDQADRYVEKQTKLQQSLDTAKIEHLKSIATVSEHMAGIASSYQEAVKEPGADKNAAWQRLLINAANEGYPIDNLLSVPPAQRDAVVADFVDKAESTAQRSKLEQEMIRQVSLNKRAEAAAALKVKLAKESTNRSAAIQAGIKDRWESSQGLARYKTHEADTKTSITVAQRDRDDYDQQISAVDAKIRDIEAGNILTIKKADRPAAIEALRQDRELLQNSRNETDNQVKTLEGQLTELHDTFTKSGLKEEPAKPEPTSVDIDTVRAGADKAIKDGADPVKVAARFKEVTGQEYVAKKDTTAAPAATTTEPEALKYINSQGDLDRAIKSRLLNSAEIKAAKEKIKNLSVKAKENKAAKAEEERVNKLRELSLKNGPLTPLTL
jgi:hypothetical protein